MPILRGAPLSVGVMLIAASAARAQAVAPPSPTDWTGLAGGISIGLGTLSIEPGRPYLPAGTRGGLGGGAWGGWRFAPRFAATVDLNVVGALDQSNTPALLVAALQYYATPRVWFKAGIGRGTLEAFTTALTRVSEHGRAYSAEAGTDFFQYEHLILEVHARFDQTKFGESRARSFSVQLGFAGRLKSTTVTPAPPMPKSSAPPSRNIFGYEVMGRSGLIGVAYERLLSPRFGVGIGAGSGWDLIDESASGLVPIYATATPIGDRHRLFLGAGVALVHVSKDVQAVGWVPRTGWSTYGTMSVGYEHRSESGIWRLTIAAWHQKSGVPGGVKNVRESGFFFMPGFLKTWRF